MSGRQQQSVTVSGPGVDRAVPDVGCGLSLAQGLACRAKAACTFYVRNGSTAYAVERTADGVVLTTRTTREGDLA